MKPVVVYSKQDSDQYMKNQKCRGIKPILRITFGKTKGQKTDSKVLNLQTTFRLLFPLHQALILCSRLWPEEGKIKFRNVVKK
jgi:hypothetical protein